MTPRAGIDLAPGPGEQAGARGRGGRFAVRPADGWGDSDSGAGGADPALSTHTRARGRGAADRGPRLRAIGPRAKERRLACRGGRVCVQCTRRHDSAGAHCRDWLETEQLAGSAAATLYIMMCV